MIIYMGGQVTWDQCLREFTAEEKLTNLNSLSYYVHMFWRSSLNLNPSLNSLSYYVHMFPRQLTTRLSSCLNSHDREAVIPQSRCRGIGV